MTSAVPGILAWPLIAFMVAVVAARYILLSDTAFDRYLNNTLAFMLIVQLLREHQVQRLLEDGALFSVTATQQLSLGFMIPACTEFLGFTTLWSGRSEEDTRTAYLRYRRAGIVLFAAFLVVGTGARRAHQTLEAYPGWDGAWAWVIYLAMLVVLSVQLLRMCIAELLHSPTRRERLVATAGIAVGLLIGFATLEALILPFTNRWGLTDPQLQLRFHGYNFFFEATGAAMIAAWPFVMQLLARWGLEPVSRSWRKLQPLRESMRAAVPGTAFDLAGHVSTSGRRRSLLQLHQSTVEIRDAVLQLRPFFGDVCDHDVRKYFKASRVPARQHPAARRALLLACAVRNKAAGVTPKAWEVSAVAASRSATLDDEITDLLAVARWWPSACAASQHLDFSAERVQR
jgi:hypothetical protein